MSQTIPNRSLHTVLLISWVSLLLLAAGCGRSAMAAVPPVAAPAQLQLHLQLPEAEVDGPELIGLAESLYAGTPQPRALQQVKKARTPRR